MVSATEGLGSWAALIEAIPDAVVVVDAEGRIREANDHTEQVLGYPPGELVGRPLGMLIPVDRRHAHHRMADATFARPDQPARPLGAKEVVALHRDGRTLPVDVHLNHLELPEGRFVLATVRDMSTARGLRDELARANDLFRSVLDGATEQAIIAADLSGTVTMFNRGAERMLGHAAADMVGRDVGVLGDRLAPAGVVEELRNAPENARSLSEVLLTARGTQVDVLLSASLLRQAGEVVGVLYVATDMTVQREVEQALVHSEQRFRSAFEDAATGMLLVHLHGEDLGRIVRANRALTQMTGYRTPELVGTPLTSFTTPEVAAATVDALRAMAERQIQTWEHERTWRHADGSTVWVHVSTSAVRDQAGAPLYAVAQVQDVTARKRAEADLTFQALHDSLTGLPNRALLAEYLLSALARARRGARHVGVLYLDLDDFKTVNDSLGHAAGDEILVQLAQRLRDGLRETDLPARLGGDEFVVVCEDLARADDVLTVAERVIEILGAPFVVGDRVLTMSCSLGVTVSDALSTPETLMRDSDAAMYQAKDRGKGRYEVADLQLQARALRKLELEEELRHAVHNGELALVYQPSFDVATGRLVGTEALLRWHHPTRGLLLPADFLDVAESSELIGGIGAWVVQQAALQAAQWQHELDTAAPIMWVNASTRQLGRQLLTGTVREALAVAGLAPDRFGVEIVERQMLNAAHSVLDDLLGLVDLGVRLAIDDFGTGHNGMEYLRTIPADTLKIDRSFISGLGQDHTDTALTASIISLARALELTVVAEGVETREQLRELEALGCHLAQGYLLAPPVEPAELARLLRP